MNEIPNPQPAAANAPPICATAAGLPPPGCNGAAAPAPISPSPPSGERAGVRGIDSLHSSFVIPLDLLSRRSRDRAEKWMNALLPALQRWDHPGITHAELERSAVEAAQRILGERFSTRHVRRMIAQALERDAGQQQWNRVELFLEKRPALATVPASLAGRAEFDDLLDTTAASLHLANPRRPRKPPSCSPPGASIRARSCAAPLH